MRFRPFECLKEFISKEKLPSGREIPLCQEEPEEFFKKVRPLKDRDKFFWKMKTTSPKTLTCENLWPPKPLKVKFWQTSEYIEGRAPGVTKELLRKLREGKIAYSRVLDLHGLSVAEAEVIFHQFIKSCLFKGDRCVLIIHGRGLSSPERPVLKEKVQFWLTKGPLRRYILAFASARACDGGPGATYVLLTSKPWKAR